MENGKLIKRTRQMHSKQKNTNNNKYKREMANQLIKWKKF